MMRKWIYIALILTLFALIAPEISPKKTTVAQEASQALTLYAVTVYNRPDRDSSIIGILTPQAKVLLEARNINTTWVLGRSADGTIRGWIESRYLQLASETEVQKLLFSNEVVFIPSSTDLSTTYDTINLSDYPIIPSIMGQARTIYERGQQSGADQHVVSKIGDCISDNQHFLSPFGTNQYNLGRYHGLESVIRHFREALAYDSLAAYDGLVTNAVLDPLFANPLACLPGESPLRCEYRIHRPSAAIIMFGAQDLLFTSAEDFDRNLRQIIHETVQAGVVPILSTFPGNLEHWEQSIRYNQIVVKVAQDYDIPLMNLWHALYSLPNRGLNADGRHLSLPITNSGDFDPSNLQRGYPMRNLIALQSLDAVWQNVMY